MASKTTEFRKGRALTIPASVDWRTAGIVSPIRDQKICGSCWAFSAASEIESYYAKANNQLIDLSEQNLVDCTYSSDGCQGGWMTDAYEY